MGPRTKAPSPFVYALPVPGRVELPGGRAVETDASPSGDDPRVAIPEGARLVVRTRRPGDRVFWRGREISLKRLLLDRRIPAEERDCLPVLAAGERVLWFPGATLEGRVGDRWIGLRIAAPVETAGTRT